VLAAVRHGRVVHDEVAVVAHREPLPARADADLLGAPGLVAGLPLTVALVAEVAVPDPAVVPGALALTAVAVVADVPQLRAPRPRVDDGLVRLGVDHDAGALGALPPRVLGLDPAAGPALLELGAVP